MLQALNGVSIDQGGGRRERPATGSPSVAKSCPRSSSGESLARNWIEANYDLEYLIDGVLVAGQPCILAGGKKALKTSLLIDLGISLAMGGCFLGRLKVNRACPGGHYDRGKAGLPPSKRQPGELQRRPAIDLADIGGLVFF